MQAEGSSTDQSSAIVQEKATAQAIIFDKTALSQAIVGQVLPDTAGQPVIVNNLSDLTFAFASSTQNIASSASFDPSSLNQISFSLTGSATVIWTFDENMLKTNLLGLTKDQAQSLISANKSIQEAWIVTRPFWNQTIPNDPNKVTLTNSLDK